MKSNSVAQVVKQYTFQTLSNQTWKVEGIIYDVNDANTPQNPNLIITANQSYIYLNKTTNTIAYTITAKNNLKGMYAMLPGICGESPFAIGLNESEIDPSLLLYFFKATYSCPAMGPNTPDERIVNMTGIISKEITIDQGMVSPLKQQDANLPPELVICKQGLQLIIKTEDNSPACVKPETAMKLVERGWGHLLH